LSNLSGKQVQRKGATRKKTATARRPKIAAPAKAKYYRVKPPQAPRKRAKRKAPPSVFDRARNALRRTLTPKRTRATTSPRKAAKKRTATVRRIRPHASMRFFSDGRSVRATISRRTASVIGAYLAAVRRLLDTNDAEQLEQFAGRSVRDVHGTVFLLETRPNVLYQLNEAVEPFEEVYRLIA
jgi:hypothetical protein